MKSATAVIAAVAIVLATSNAVKIPINAEAESRYVQNQTSERNPLTSTWPSKREELRTLIGAKTQVMMMHEVDILHDDNYSCPTWTYRYPTANGSCECGDTLNGAIQCNNSSHHLAIHVCYCMTYDESTEVTVVGPCPFTCVLPDHDSYRTLPLNVSQLNIKMCESLHRTGQLCGHCEEGYKIPAYSNSFKCVICDHTNNWLKYFAIVFVPLTIFLLIVLCFRISATSAKLNAFVFFSQIISAPTSKQAIFEIYVVHHWPKILTQIELGLYGIWNLEFFRTLSTGICLEFSSLQLLALDYAIAFYPMLMMVVFYLLIQLHDSDYRLFVYLWKPFHKCLSRFRRQWNATTSTVDAFATFLLLSYIKLLCITAYILTPTQVYDIRGRKVGLYLYYDATIRYFGEEHLPYALFALFVLFTFILAPLLLLILYPMRCFQRCLGRFRVRWHALHIFADSFQGCYKDGTNGTRDCRYFAAIYLTVRILLYSVIEFTPTSIMSIFWESIIVFLFSISVAIAQPYKPTYSIYNTVDTVLNLLLAEWFLSLIGILLTSFTTSTDILAKTWLLLALSITISLLPLLYFIIIILKWLCSNTILRNKFFSRMSLQRRASQDSLPDRMLNPDHYCTEVNNPISDVRYENMSEGEYEPLLSPATANSDI